MESKTVEHFDLRQPHLVCTGDKGLKTIVQNGFVYSYSIPDKARWWHGGKILGPVSTMKPAIVAQGHKFCDFCGYSFGDMEGLERHMYTMHRDALVVSLINSKPKDLKLGELPSEDQIKSEAGRLVTGDEAKEALEKAATPAQKAFDEVKAKKKNAYRQPV